MASETRGLFSKSRGFYLQYCCSTLIYSFASTNVKVLRLSLIKSFYSIISINHYQMCKAKDRREVGKHRQSQFLGSALLSILREKTLHHLGTWAAQNHSPFPYMSLLQSRCRYGEMTLAQIHPVSNISMLSYFLLLLHDRKDLFFLFFTTLQQISQSQSSSSCLVLHKTLKYSLEQTECMKTDL